LRKAGQLTEARQLAETLLNEAPNNRYNQRAAAWVYVEYLKTQSSNLATALSYLEGICGFRFDTSENILWEQLYWQVAKLLFRTTEAPEQAVLERFWPCWKAFAQLEGQAFSTLLKAVLKHAATWPNLPDWVECWGWGHLQPADFMPEQLPNGKTMPALAERVYLAVAKTYLNQPATEQSAAFLHRLDTVSEAHPDLLYLVYYRALLRLKAGQLAEALAFILPFAQKKQRDFWVWDLLAQLHPHDVSMQTACLAKALSCKTSPEFLVKIRQKMAGLLVAQGHWPEARTEIEALCRVREAHRWRIPSEVVSWIDSTAYQNSVANNSNANLYTQWAKVAEKRLHSNKPAVVGVVWSINKEKQTAQFVVDEQIHGGFNYAKLGVKDVEIGQALRLRLHQVKRAEGDFWQVQEAELSPEPPSEYLVKSFAGSLRMAGKVGFVGQVMVGSQQIDFEIRSYEAPEVTGRAVRAFDPKHQKWGWRALYVRKKV